MYVLIFQSGLKLKLHNRNEIEPHWAPGPSFPGFGSNTVRFSWPRVTGQVHLGHHSLYPPPVNSANGRRVGTTWSAIPNTSAIIPWLSLNNSEIFQVQATSSWARLVFEHPIFQSQSFDAMNLYIVKDTFYEFSKYVFGKLCILAISMEKFYFRNSTYGTYLLAYSNIDT